MVSEKEKINIEKRKEKDLDEAGSTEDFEKLNDMENEDFYLEEEVYEAKRANKVNSGIHPVEEAEEDDEQKLNEEEDENE